MSEIANAPVKAKRSRTKFIVIALLILVLLIIYGAGIIVLPITILTNYQSKDCDSALSLNNMYTSMYPGFIQDQTLSAPVKECKDYGLAVSNERMGNWREAYDAYQAYSKTYPNGLYAAEAHAHGATALLKIVKDQTQQKNYAEAVANLNLIVSSYADTNVSAEAWTLFPSIYTEWGSGLRESADFEKAEQVFNEFKAWSQNNQKAELATKAQSGLAQTYLAWSLALQSQKQFEGALAKLDLTISADPQSQFDSTAQAKSGQRKVYIEWGNDFLKQSDFSGAIEKFNLAVSKSAGNNEDGVSDALANGYIKWAHALSVSEDFKGALAQMETAKQTAVSDAMKKSVETALQDTYLAFSNSSGPQARQAMKEVLATICKKHKKPALPIFGLNKDVIRFGVYGVDAQLPENLTPKTPGEIHYVACVEEQNQTVETRSKMVILLRTARGYYYTIVKQFRVQLLWNIHLLKTDTIESIANRTFTGGKPPPFTGPGDVGSNYFPGPPPSMDELAQWLLSIIK